MRNRDNKLEPIPVKNPETGRYVNVAPLFNLVNIEYDGDFKQLSDQIDYGAVMFAGTATETMQNAPLEAAGIFYTLFSLRDTIRNMNEYKEDGRH
jgi:hypothetical protein